MERGTPERLLHEKFMPLDEPFHLFRHQLEWPVPAHWHEFFEIALVTEGTGIHTFNGRRAKVRRGSLFLLTPADFHEVEPSAGETLRLYNAIFVQRFIRPELLQWIYQAGGGLAAEFNETELLPLEAEFELMWAEAERPRPGGEWIVAGALERVLVAALRQLPVQLPAGGQDKRKADAAVIHPAIRQAVAYISYQFHDDLSLAQVSRHVGLSANYFSECFREETGVPFQRYLQELRLKYAYSLLGMTRLPVTEICYASGFGNLSHFERAFKRKYGRTPRQIRSEAARPG